MTYLHKFKCMNCGLHFIVCSWYKEIAPVYCPECGKKDDNFHWIEEVDQPIFRFVPGPTPPTGFVTESGNNKYDNKYITSYNWDNFKQPAYAYEKGWHVIKERLESQEHYPKIKIIGAGIAGCNAIYKMAIAQLRCIDLIAVVSSQEILDRFVQRMSNVDLGFGTSVYTWFNLPKTLDRVDIAIAVAEFEDDESMRAISAIGQLAKNAGALMVAVILTPTFSDNSLITQVDNNSFGMVDTLITVPGKSSTGKDIPIVDLSAVVEDPLVRTVQCISDFIAQPFLFATQRLDEYQAVLSSSKGVIQRGVVGMGYGDGENGFQDALAMVLKTGIPMNENCVYYGNLIIKSYLPYYENEVQLIQEYERRNLPSYILWGGTIDERFQHDVYLTILCTDINRAK